MRSHSVIALWALASLLCSRTQPANDRSAGIKLSTEDVKQIQASVPFNARVPTPLPVVYVSLTMLKKLGPGDGPEAVFPQHPRFATFYHPLDGDGQVTVLKSLYKKENKWVVVTTEELPPGENELSLLRERAEQTGRGKDLFVCEVPAWNFTFLAAYKNGDITLFPYASYHLSDGTILEKGSPVHWSTIGPKLHTMALAFRGGGSS